MPYKPNATGTISGSPHSVSYKQATSPKRFVGYHPSQSKEYEHKRSDPGELYKVPLHPYKKSSETKLSLQDGGKPQERGDSRGSAASDSGAEFVPVNDNEPVKNYDEFGFVTDKTYAIDIKEQEREIKWSKMLFPNGNIASSDILERNAYWEQVVKKKWKKKLKSRIRKGIPNVFRGEAWVHISGARKARLNQPNVYRNILDNQGLCAFEEQIWKDIRRSYRSHSLFERDDSSSQESLYNVLCAYSIYNSSTGYNQGMSFVCSLLLLYMDEEDAFWMMHALATDPKYAMEGVWSNNMPLVSVRFNQFKYFLKKFEPKINAKFEEYFISPGMYQATQWFVTVFLATELPHSTILLIWDVFLHDGIKAIIRIGLALIKRRKADILKVKDELTLLEMLKSTTTMEHATLIQESCKIPIHRKHIVQQDREYSTE